jgi:acyl carrier protein
MTRDGLLTFLRSRLGLREELDDDTPIFSTGLLDSFSMVELIAHLEAENGIKIGAMEVTLENLDSLERILRFVEAKRNAA